VCNFDINQFHEIVPMPEGLEPVALIPIGYPADEQAPKVRKEMEDVWQ
jgi:nitroreductase